MKSFIILQYRMKYVIVFTVDEEGINEGKKV